MKPKTLLVLLLLVLGLGAFIWFFERDLPGSEERARQEKRVVALEADEITEIVIERGDSRVRLVRAAQSPTEGEADQVEADQVEVDGGAPAAPEWRLAEPYEARADGASADRLAESLAGLEKERTLEDVDPAAVGLDTPRATVSVYSPAGEVTLRVGAEVPASSNMVVASGEQTLVVSDSVWELLGKEAGDWRSRDLFPLHRGAVERLQLAGGPAPVAPVTLAKRDDGSFWLEGGVVDKADQNRVEELLDAMFRVEIGDYLDEPRQPAAEMGLEPAEQSLSVSFVDRERPFTVELGSPTPDGSGERFARVGGQVVTVGDELDEALARPVADWQETAWTGLEVFQIDSFRVVDADGELLLERSGSDWSRGGESIAYGSVSDFLYALNGVAGTRVVDRQEARELGAELEKPSLEIDLKGSDREESLRLYDAEEGAVAGSAGRDYWLTVPLSTVEDLRVKLEAIRDEQPLSDEPSEGTEG